MIDKIERVIGKYASGQLQDTFDSAMKRTSCILSERIQIVILVSLTSILFSALCTVFIAQHEDA